MLDALRCQMKADGKQWRYYVLCVNKVFKQSRFKSRLNIVMFCFHVGAKHGLVLLIFKLSSLIVNFSIQFTFSVSLLKVLA
jgi:hypothetical protein